MIVNYVTEIFNFNSLSFNVRIVKEAGEVWYCGKDVCDALGYANSKDAMKRLVIPENKLGYGIHTSGQGRLMTFLNFNGLMQLACRSSMPQAVNFQNWAYSVLKSIYTTGAYVEPDLTRYYLEHPEQSPEFFQEQLNLRNQEIANLERQLGKTKEKLDISRATCRTIKRDYKNYRKDNETYINSIQPQLNYYNEVLQSPGTLLITEIAKRYGMSASQLNQILHDLGIQFRLSNGVWVLYDEYANLGYTANRTVQGPDGNFYNETVWTELGANFIHNLLIERGIVK